MAHSGQPAARYRGVPLGIHFASRSEGVSIQTSLQVGQSLRISRCASTPRRAAAILYPSTPMSTSRVTALDASLEGYKIAAALRGVLDRKSTRLNSSHT